jgi:hypothetical protein
VGDTLALPVRLLGQVSPGEIGVSAPMARLVEAWCALQPHEVLVGREPELALLDARWA